MLFTQYRTRALYRACRKLTGQRFVWEGMNKDIANFAKACISCQQVKIHRHNTPPLQSFLQPDSRFSSIHYDLVGPLSESSGHAYLLAVIDRFSRHLECIPLREITAKACADAFLLNWVPRCCCLQLMTCDRGTQFTSHLWVVRLPRMKTSPHDSLPPRKQRILGTPTPHLESGPQSSKQPS